MSVIDFVPNKKNQIGSDALVDIVTLLINIRSI